VPISVPSAPGPSPRSANMRANRRRETKLEIRVRQHLHRRGFRFRVDYPIRLDGRRPIRPDLVFTRLRICVELDGCWWHGCEECGYAVAGVNENYWRQKIARNKERDVEQTAALEQAGWTVLRFWAHRGPDAISDAVADALTSLAATRPSSA
jgi:DNA mismatch endonuclease, patch repair protein